MIDQLLKDSLYFSTNILSRNLDRLAKSAFKTLDISPNHALTLLVINDIDSSSPCEIAKTMTMDPSTITRFIDQLEKKDYVTRHYKGRCANVTLTEKGMNLLPEIEACWNKINSDCEEILGRDFSQSMAKKTDEAKVFFDKHKEEN